MPATPQHDSDWVVLALEGDQHAFSNLMQRHKKPLSAYLQRQFSIGMDVEDIMLVIFDKAFGNLKKYNPKFAFSTWLYTIADHVCIDSIRKKKSLAHTSLDAAKTYDLHYSEQLPAPSNPESELIASQEEAILLQYIDRLKPIYREPARLRFLHDYAYEEIAKELSIPEGTVKIRIHRAKEILTKWITAL